MRSARPVCCRAQDDDRPRAPLECQPAGQAAWDQSGQRLLPAPASFPGRSGVDAPDRCVALRVSLGWQPDVAGVAPARRLCRGPPACRHAAEADGDDGAYRRPTTSPPTPGHQLDPSRLRKLAVTSLTKSGRWTSLMDQWRVGLVYLVAVVDWVSRTGLAWRLSMTLETEPCVEALSEALARHGRPEIMNTAQGSPFTSVAVLTALQDAKIALSMDGKGAWRDNVFVERLWRTITDEEVYLRAYRSVSEARRGLDRYLAFYNRRRPHSSLGGQTPDQAYFNQPTPIPAAA